MFLFSSKKIINKIKWLLSESYISKSVKRIENITFKKVLAYILASDEKSKKNLILVTLGHF